MKNTISLRKVLFISFTLISIIPILFLSFGVQRAAFDLELKAVEDKHLIIARNVTGALERYLMDVKSGLRTFAENSKDKKPAQEVIDLIHDLNFKSIWRLQKDGSSHSLLAHALPTDECILPQETIDHIVNDVRIFTASRNETKITGIMRDEELQPVFYVTKKLDNSSVLVASVGIDYIREVQENISFGEKGHAAIVDQYGKVMAHPHKQWVESSKDISFLGPVKKMKDGLTGVTQFYTPAMEADMIAGHTVVKSVGWGVMIPQPIAELEEEAKYAQMIALLVTLFGLAIAAILSWLLSVYITRPVNRIVAFTETIATGNVERVMPIEKRFAPLEIYQLTNVFNQMIERLKNKTDELVVTALRLRHAQKIAHLGNWELDIEDNSMWWSDEVYRILNIQKGYKFSPNLTDFTNKMSDLNKEVFLEKITLASNHAKPFSLDQTIDIGEGKRISVHLEILVQKKESNSGVCITGTIQDISERKKYEDILFFQAHYDTLTNLPNRQLCLEKLKSNIERSAAKENMVPLLVVGLDHFKEVNESLGHLAGDQILKMAAVRIQHAVREIDTVARLGSDEFAVVLANIKSKEELNDIAGKIIKSFEKSFVVNDIETIVGSSIGISVFPRDGADPLTLLQKADTALHEIKTKSGRGAYCEFTSSMNEEVLKRMNLRSDLALAIANSELHLVYQPIVDSMTGQVNCAEALLRWNHPSRGEVPPEMFIPLAEKTGYIRDIGIWILETACQELRNWRDQGMAEITLSINLSLSQVQYGLDTSSILRIIDSFGLKPSDLTLEITESMIMEDMDSCLSWMNDVTDAGIKFAIDDFGTGYSSLSYLLNLPVSSVKIDGSFVSNMLYGEKDATLIETIVSLSKKLGFIVVAEGVETIEHRKKLIKYGCDQLQGHFFSKPLLAKDFPKYIELRTVKDVVS